MTPTGTSPLFDALPVYRGFPVPWFAHKTADGWDFKRAGPGKRAEAVRRGLCWVTGEPLGRWKGFVLDPISALRRSTVEPPCKPEVAVYSAQVCPYLTRPRATKLVGSNPGVHAVWITDRFAVEGRWLHLDAEPREVRWFREGREATRAEVMAVFDREFPDLLDDARQEGPESEAACLAAYDTVLTRIAA